MTTFAPQVPTQQPRPDDSPSSPHLTPSTESSATLPEQGVARSWVRGSGHGHAVCGEILSGTLSDGTPVRVPLPVERVAAIEASLRGGRPGVTIQHTEGPAPVLMLASVERACEELGLDAVEIRLRRRNGIAGGTDQHSASAEATAGVRALAAAAGVTLPEASVARIVAAAALATGIPSSHCAWSGLHLLDTRTGAPVRVWEWSPRFALVVATPLSPTIERTGGPDAPALEAACDRLGSASARQRGGEFAAVADQIARSYDEEEILTQTLEASTFLARSGAGPLGVAASRSGGTCALMYLADGPGRHRAMESVHGLSELLAGVARVSCTLTRPGRG